jgi:hypothetical protein
MTTTSRGIVLDSDSIRAELEESPESHDLSAEQVRLITSMSDDALNMAIDQSADDAYWAAYDQVRRNAIASLAEQTAPPMSDEIRAAEVDRLTAALLE